MFILFVAVISKPYHARDLSTYIQPGWRAFNTVGQSDRVKRISTVKAKASPEAFYLESWKRKIEAVGN